MECLAVWIWLLASGLWMEFGLQEPQVLQVEPIRLCESASIEQNSARFVVIAETTWKAKKTGCVPIEIQLRLTNLNKNEVVFPTFDTFGMRIKTPEGKLVKIRGGRNFTKLTRPVIVAPGGTYCLCRSAELHWDSDDRSGTLIYYDGTGAEMAHGPLKAGKYSLIFWYRTKGLDTAVHRELEKSTGEIPAWTGTVITRKVQFEILEP